jgi:E3 ubiquitin-protein ligase BRE1
LIRQLEVYRQEIATGEKRVADLRRQQASYESRLNAVATEWNTLQDDIVSMAKRTGASSVDPSPSMPSTSDVKDPFLRRLFELAGGEAVVAGHKRRRDADDDAGANKKGAGANEADGSGSDSEDEDGAAAKEGGLDKDAMQAVDAIKAIDEAN